MDYPYKNYVESIEQALINPKIFNNFKNNKEYNGVLEHVSEEQGRIYLREILNNKNANKVPWESVLLNDILGSPTTFYYDLPIGFTYVSPTTLRYIKFSLDVIEFLGTVTKPLNIIEIGGGYGGFCKIFLDICTEFKINIKLYTIFDLDAPSKLQKKYLEILPHGPGKIVTGTLNTNNILDSYDLLLAFYSYSELSEEVRQMYSDIIKKSDNGFMCWNVDMDNENIKKELNKNISITNEVPLTGPYNRIITWVWNSE